MTETSVAAPPPSQVGQVEHLYVAAELADACSTHGRSSRWTDQSRSEFPQRGRPVLFQPRTTDANVRLSALPRRRRAGASAGVSAGL